MSESTEPPCKRIRYKCEDNSTDEESSSDDWLKAKLKGTPQVHTMQPVKGLESVRVWENVGRRSDSGNTIKFNVVSYNVLAQCLLEEHSYLYTCSAASNLDWVTRSARLFDEIIGLAPDIICLQEVEVTYLTDFYSKFEDVGYSGVYKKKTGDSLDGCAIYFKKSMFDLKDKLSVEFQQKVPVLNRNNIGLIIKLANRDGSMLEFVVATTHLMYNPRRPETRLAQMRLFLAEIDRFAYNTSKNESQSEHLPIILTGDFNSSPETALIQLLDAGHVIPSQYPYCYPDSPSDWERLGITENCQHLSVYLNRQNSKSTEFHELNIDSSEYGGLVPKTAQVVPETAMGQYIELFRSGTITHPFDFASVYTKFKADGSCEATTYQGYWLPVDYIYFSRCDSLQVTDRLRLPTVVECAEGLGRMPNRKCPSDHFSLAAVFQFISKDSKEGK